MSPPFTTTTRLKWGPLLHSCLVLWCSLFHDHALAFTTLRTTLSPRQRHCPSSNSRTRHFMFTGIVEEMGVVTQRVDATDMVLWDGSVGTGTQLSVQSPSGRMLRDAYLGCSICISGVCTTVVAMNDNEFTVGLSPETLRRSNLGQLCRGDAVNLERASVIGGRNSGHFVQGHVDGVGHVVEKWREQESLFFKIKVGAELLKYIVPKGFIAVDGTSLTVVQVHQNDDGSGGWFTFMLIAYTQQHIIVPAKEVGDTVNLEVDVLGKYSESAFAAVWPRLEALEAKVEVLQRQVQT